MKVLQVKEYHETIAREKEVKALKRWREKDNGYGYPVKTMFYFYRENDEGYPTTERKRGYVAFNDTKSAFGLNREKAIKQFNI